LSKVPAANRWKDGRTFMVGYVGVMGAQEGIDLLIDAVECIVRHHGRNDVQFVLVGGGPSLDMLKDLVRERHLEAYITFAGRAPDSTLFEVLSTMDLGVNPDRVNAMNDKSTMNKIMEYMAFSKPMVQFDVTEGRYSAQGSSLYARSNDAEDMAEKIIQLLDDAELRETMGQIGWDRVQNELDWSKQVQPLLAAYDQVLQK
jgi:glycosyltransferase involved in cell wall biosynthesis